MKLSIKIFLCTCIIFEGTQALTINNAPSNTTTIVGQNATFACEVTKSESENVFWKRVESSSTTLIGYNELSKNMTKYVISGTYNLTILDVQLADEGVYECEAGLRKPRAFLQVAVVPPSSNVTMKWENTTGPIIANVERKLICSVFNSRPPAALRWFKGNTDVTKDVAFANTTLTAAGFGNAVSVLKVTPAVDDSGALYHCKVDLPDNPAVVTQTMTLTLGNGSSQLTGSYLATLIVALVLRS